MRGYDKTGNDMTGYDMTWYDMTWWYDMIWNDTVKNDMMQNDTIWDCQIANNKEKKAVSKTACDARGQKLENELHFSFIMRVCPTTFVKGVLPKS